jgi:hypothetical protein
MELVSKYKNDLFGFSRQVTMKEIGLTSIGYWIMYLLYLMHKFGIWHFSNPVTIYTMGNLEHCTEIYNPATK